MRTEYRLIDYRAFYNDKSFEEVLDIQLSKGWKLIESSIAITHQSNGMVDCACLLKREVDDKEQAYKQHLERLRVEYSARIDDVDIVL